MVQLQSLMITEQKYKKASEHCMKLMLDRNARYGNSIEVMKSNSIIDLVLMKLIRTRELESSDEKYTDEVVDSINYLIFLLIRHGDKIKWN